jgi:cytochrome c oxidase assembly protein subunit 15
MHDLYRPWLHRSAVLTAALVFPLLLVGGMVTSWRAGMVDPEPVRVPWYLFTAWQDTPDAHGFRFYIEHSHRQIGWIVGIMSIVLAVWLWATTRRPWLRWLGVAGVVGVSFQGVLGMLRVFLERANWGVEFAMIHGVAGQLVFTLLACIALFTSRSWIEGPTREVEQGARFSRMCKLTTLLILIQLPVGAWLRQRGQEWGGLVLIVHAILAAAILAHGIMLRVRIRRMGLTGEPLFHRPVLVLVGLLFVQVIVGVLAWLSGAGAGAFDPAGTTAVRAGLTTAHVGVGALILVTSTVLWFRSFRHLSLEPKDGSLASRGQYVAGGVA